MEFESHIGSTDPITGGRWVDCLITHKTTAHIVEWKNMHLDYVTVNGIYTIACSFSFLFFLSHFLFLLGPNIKNTAYLVKNAIEKKKEPQLKWDVLAKVKILRELSEEAVLQLKVAPFEKFYKNCTMAEVIDKTFLQTEEYAQVLKRDPRYNNITTFYMHVCLAVGSSKILYKTRMLQ